MEMEEFKIRTKEQWHGRPTQYFQKNTKPLTLVYTQNTHSSTCCTLVECSQVLRRVQNYHVFYKRLPDIMYNFMIGADGNVYEGRGWWYVPFLPTKLSKEAPNSLAIGYIGDYEDELPDFMVKAENDLLKYGVEQGFISENYERVDIREQYVPRALYKPQPDIYFKRVVRQMEYTVGYSNHPNRKYQKMGKERKRRPRSKGKKEQQQEENQDEGPEGSQ